MNLEKNKILRNVKFGERKGLIVIWFEEKSFGTTAGFCQAHR
jgi:hypothetical protein